MPLKVELTDGYYGHYELLPTEDYQDRSDFHEYDWMSTDDVPNERGNTFLYGWLESLGQGGNCPPWVWDAGEQWIRAVWVEGSEAPIGEA